MVNYQNYIRNYNYKGMIKYTNYIKYKLYRVTKKNSITAPELVINSTSISRNNMPFHSSDSQKIYAHKISFI